MSMVIKGQRYRTNMPGTMQLWVMRRVKRETGIAWSDALDFMQKAAANDLPLSELVGADEFIAWAWSWTLNTVRHDAPAPLTLDDMWTLTLDDVDFVPNDDPAEASDVDAGGDVEVDPGKASDRTDTAAADADPAAAPQSAKPHRASSGKTSSKRSRSGSS